MINISGLCKARVLAALYNASKPQNMGFFHCKPESMSVEEAKSVIAEYLKHNYMYFDYLNGRVLKVDLSKDEFDPFLYDRDLGQGAAEKIINKLRVEQ